MPQSKKREAQKHPPIDYIPHQKKRKSATPVAVAVCALFGIGIAWFASGSSMAWLILGAVLGGTFGYFLGYQMDKSLDKPQK